MVSSKTRQEMTSRFNVMTRKYKDHLENHVDGTAWFFKAFLDDLNEARRDYFLFVMGLWGKDIPPNITGPVKIVFRYV